MELLMGKLLTFSLCISLFEGWMVQSVPYDHTASIECLSDPMRPLYNGGVIQNSEFNNGLMGWSVPRGVKAGVSSSPSGNNFAAASNNARPSHSVFQRIEMQTNHHYSLSAWLQVSAGTAEVKAIFKAPDGAYVAGGAVVVKSGCWSMLKGGITAYSSGPAELFFEANGTVDIWVDSVSLQPFSFTEWNAQRRLSADKARKSAVKVVVAQGGSGTGKPLRNATVRVDLLRRGFPFGNAMTKEILDISAYERWFTSRFTVATFENEMKWYSTERRRGQEDYRVPDAMLRLAEKHGIEVRGHNVLWDDPNTQMKWVAPLDPERLKAAVRRRLTSVVTRYAGKVIAWDVVNENLHWGFYESRLGPDASPEMYRQVAEIDGTATLFMNEFNTLEQPTDMAALPSKYVDKMNRIRSYPGNGAARVKLAVGLESHFSTAPNIPYVRGALDTLAQLELPIWLTEIDVGAGPYQAEHLEEVLREGYGHPGVQGMVMWAAWHPAGCYVMCLTDNGFNNLPVGDVVDRLIAEWKTHPEAATTDENGVVELDLVHGEYSFTVTHPSLVSPAVHTVTVDASSSALDHAVYVEV